jgi:hypothetical protein
LLVEVAPTPKFLVEKRKLMVKVSLLDERGGPTPEFLIEKRKLLVEVSLLRTDQGNICGVSMKYIIDQLST